MSTLVLRWGALVACLLFCLGLQSRISRHELAREAGFWVPEPSLSRWAALGFEALLGDFYWLRAVQVVGASPTDPSRHAKLLGRLIDVTTTLDPWVDHPYRFAALWLTDGPESVRTANRLLERGIAYHPEDWRNRFYLSFNHFFYLADEAAAAEALEPALDLPGAPIYLSRLQARLRAEDAGLEVAAAYLQELARNAPDGQARAEYEKALDEIETERRARLLDRAREVYRERHGRDIEKVEDLVQGPGAVLAKLPPELHGWGWILSPETGEIVSDYYRRRYQLSIHPNDRQRREAWNQEQG